MSKFASISIKCISEFYYLIAYVPQYNSKLFVKFLAKIYCLQFYFNNLRNAKLLTVTQ